MTSLPGKAGGGQEGSLLSAAGLRGGRRQSGGPPANSFIKGNPPIYPIRPPPPPPTPRPASIILPLLFAPPAVTNLPLPSVLLFPSGWPQLQRRCRHAMGREGRVGNQPPWSSPSPLSPSPASHPSSTPCALLSAKKSLVRHRRHRRSPQPQHRRRP